MIVVPLAEAKNNLSKLVERAATRGEGFIIARAGKPLVKVVPLAQADKPKRRIGFLKGRIKVPDNWKEIGREEIEALFEGDA